jgi:hypothetical protein
VTLILSYLSRRRSLATLLPEKTALNARRRAMASQRSVAPQKSGVVEECCGVLTNYEVLHLLRSQSADRTTEETKAPLTGARRTGSSQSQYQTQQLAYAAAINEDVVAYLEEACCVCQSPESIAAFMKACEPFNLKRAEILNLINEQPGTLVEIHLIVEECEERLTQEQVQELLATVALLPAKILVNGELVLANGRG